MQSALIPASSQSKLDLQTCLICQESTASTRFFAIAKCNHPVCATCAIRQRVYEVKTGANRLSEDLDYNSRCATCRELLDTVIISVNLREFQTFNLQKDQQNQVPQYNQQQGDEATQPLISEPHFNLFFENRAALIHFRNLMACDCRVCRNSCVDMPTLKQHSETYHELTFCDLCIKYSTRLPNEMYPMTRAKLSAHMNDEASGHPACQFCSGLRFYYNDYLTKHVKQEHFTCDVCTRSDILLAFQSQPELIRHYDSEHHRCEECTAQGGRINVFQTLDELRKHKVQHHPTGLRGHGNLVEQGVIEFSFSGGGGGGAAANRAYRLGGSAGGGGGGGSGRSRGGRGGGGGAVRSHHQRRRDNANEQGEREGGSEDEATVTAADGEKDIRNVSLDNEQQFPRLGAAPPNPSNVAAASPLVPAVSNMTATAVPSAFSSGGGGMDENDVRNAFKSASNATDQSQAQPQSQLIATTTTVATTGNSQSIATTNLGNLATMADKLSLGSGISVGKTNILDSLEHFPTLGVDNAGGGIGSAAPLQAVTAATISRNPHSWSSSLGAAASASTTSKSTKNNKHNTTVVAPSSNQNAANDFPELPSRAPTGTANKKTSNPVATPTKSVITISETAAAISAANAAASSANQNASIAEKSKKSKKQQQQSQQQKAVKQDQQIASTGAAAITKLLSNQNVVSNQNAANTASVAAQPIKKPQLINNKNTNMITGGGQHQVEEDFPSLRGASTALPSAPISWKPQQQLQRHHVEQSHGNNRAPLKTENADEFPELVAHATKTSNATATTNHMVRSAWNTMVPAPIKQQTAGSKKKEQPQPPSHQPITESYRQQQQKQEQQQPPQMQSGASNNSVKASSLVLARQQPMGAADPFDDAIMSGVGGVQSESFSAASGGVTSFSDTNPLNRKYAFVWRDGGGPMGVAPERESMRLVQSREEFEKLKRSSGVTSGSTDNSVSSKSGPPNQRNAAAEFPTLQSAVTAQKPAKLPIKKSQNQQPQEQHDDKPISNRQAKKLRNKQQYNVNPSATGGPMGESGTSTNVAPITSLAQIDQQMERPKLDSAAEANTPQFSTPSHHMEFTAPSQLDTHNTALFDQIGRELEAAQFNDFLSLASQFRMNQLTSAQQFCESAAALLSAQQFGQWLPVMCALLPDLDLQTRLWKALLIHHSTTTTKTATGINKKLAKSAGQQQNCYAGLVRQCDACGQVCLLEDYQEHLMLARHSTNAQTPSNKTAN